MRKQFTLFVTIILLFAVTGLAQSRKKRPIKAKAKVIEGTITRYECGDNCYLIITDKKGKEHTGLCAARPLCTEWNAETIMPDSYKGKSVKVTVGKGKQYDGAGNVMGTMDAFTKIQILPAPTSVSAQTKTTQSKSEITDIRRVDFLNYTYQSPLCSQYIPGSSRTVKIRKGEFRNREVYFGVVEDQVIYGDMTGDVSEEAIVHIGCGLQSANSGLSDIFIYTLQSGRATLLAELNDTDMDRDYDRYYPNGTLWSVIDNGVKVKGSNLVVERFAEGSHAAPEYIVTMNYRWGGENLTLSEKPQRRNTGF